MAQLLEKLFGALCKESCLYFYILSILSFVLYVFAILAIIVYMVKHRKNMSYNTITHMVIVSIHLLIAYFVNRLLHTICIKTLA